MKFMKYQATCTHCDKTYSRSSSLKRHIQRTHPDVVAATVEKPKASRKEVQAKYYRLNKDRILQQRKNRSKTWEHYLLKQFKHLPKCTGLTVDTQNDKETNDYSDYYDIHSDFRPYKSQLEDSELVEKLITGRELYGLYHYSK